MTPNPASQELLILDLQRRRDAALSLKEQAEFSLAIEEETQELARLRYLTVLKPELAESKR